MMQHGRPIKVMIYNKAYDLSSYQFQLNEKILIDANIWLYLFPPPQSPQYQFAESYSVAFDSLYRAKAQPVLDPLVMSEYLNRYCRMEFRGRFQGQYSEFKHFRRSAEFRQVSEVARKFAQNILTISRSHSLSPDEMDLKQAVDEFAHGNMDFNDAILLEICRKREMKLMTNDSDFQFGGIDILTVHPRLLQTCST